MSETSLTSSIELPETFSVGQFEIDCATPYSQNPWIDETSTDNWMLEVECMPGHVFVFHGHGTNRTDNRNVGDKSAFLRLVCHVLVDRIDAKGLQEVCQSLAEFYQYYRPALQSTRLLPNTRTRNATVGAR